MDDSKIAPARIRQMPMAIPLFTRATATFGQPVVIPLRWGDGADARRRRDTIRPPFGSRKARHNRSIHLSWTAAPLATTPRSEAHQRQEVRMLLKRGAEVNGRTFARLRFLLRWAPTTLREVILNNKCAPRRGQAPKCGFSRSGEYFGVPPGRFFPSLCGCFQEQQHRSAPALLNEGVYVNTSEETGKQRNTRCPHRAKLSVSNLRTRVLVCD